MPPQYPFDARPIPAQHAARAAQSSTLACIDVNAARLPLTRGPEEAVLQHGLEGHREGQQWEKDLLPSANWPAISTSKAWTVSRGKCCSSTHLSGLLLPKEPGLGCLRLQQGAPARGRRRRRSGARRRRERGAVTAMERQPSDMNLTGSTDWAGTRPRTHQLVEEVEEEDSVAPPAAGGWSPPPTGGTSR